MVQSRIIVAGYISLDITPAFPESYKGRTLGEVILPGKLRKVGAVETSPGGCVTNTGMALHTLGADVSLVAKLGDDSFGSIVQEAYRKRGARAEFIISNEVDTSYTVVIAVPGNDRCFLVNPGANDHFYETDFNLEKLTQAEYFHFGYPALMESMYKDGGKALASVLRSLQEGGVLTSLDMAFPDPASDAGRVDWTLYLQTILPYVDFFVPSIEELCFMLDRERFVRWQEKAVKNGSDICMDLSLEEDVKPLAKKALSLGCGAVLLKCGAAGMYLVTSDEARMVSLGERRRAHALELGEKGNTSGEEAFTGIGWGGIDRFQESFKPDIIRSGTGAGDTAIAGFLYGLSHGCDPVTCMELAAGCGSMCITQYDTLSGLIPIPEVLKRIRGGWELQHFILP